MNVAQPGPMQQPNLSGNGDPLPANNSQPSSSLLQPRNVQPNPNEWKYQRRRRRPQGLKGTVEGTHFKAGPSPNRDLWIFNVDSTINDDDLRKYIAEGGNKQERNINIRKWEARYKSHYSSKCFRLTIGLEDYKIVYDSEFRPKDIGVRKYWVEQGEDD